MVDPIVGLHHVTAIASDPQRNLDSYTECCVEADLTTSSLAIVGFSQGPCLEVEYNARHPAHCGVLIGSPDGELHHDGLFASTKTLAASATSATKM